MKRPTIFAAALLASAAPLLHAAAPAQPPRWINAEDVRVRTGPGADYRINGLLPRGAEVILKAPAQGDGFCLIEGEGQYGYLSCKFLSATLIPRPRAGVDGVDAAQRWITGNGVTLREQASADAPVLQRLGVNSIVKLLREIPSSGYCEVQPATGAPGFTACRYLGVQAVILANVYGHRPSDLPPSPDYSPERAFWLSPSWAAMESYAEFLKTRHAKAAENADWPRDEALEKMKAHLALGIKGGKPAPYADWNELKRKAAGDVDADGQLPRLQAQGKVLNAEQSARLHRTTNAASVLSQSLSLWGPLHDVHSGEGGAARTIRFVRALELPAVQPSLFRSEADVAPPHTSAEEASGRFGIIFRQLVSPRPRVKPSDEPFSGAGLYDMLDRTQALVRSVQRVQLFRDGALRTEASVLRNKQKLWRDVDEPMCNGWSPGFSFGAADDAIWKYFDAEAPGTGKESAALNPNPPGSLYAFYTPFQLPAGKAARTESNMNLNAAATGFVRGTHLHYDLDRDGIYDLSIWEGQGKGPGHLDGMTTTDDRWYRVAFVNINGAWKVLGSDTFGYGCGC